GRHLDHIQIGGEDQQQRGEEHRRVDQPGAAEQQCHLHHRLGLEQHEGRAEEEHPVVRPPGALRLEQIDEAEPEHAEQDHRANGEVGDQPPADIEERPVVAGRLPGAFIVDHQFRRRQRHPVAALRGCLVFGFLLRLVETVDREVLRRNAVQPELAAVAERGGDAGIAARDDGGEADRFR
ncbi:hypothetical protein chiPu_0032881, partial [Chiloscyllium punctatum]|nr:hypothetical protein [Chiloscyllium punctatum]